MNYLKISQVLWLLFYIEIISSVFIQDSLKDIISIAIVISFPIIVVLSLIFLIIGTARETFNSKGKRMFLIILSLQIILILGTLTTTISYMLFDFWRTPFPMMG